MANNCINADAAQVDNAAISAAIKDVFSETRTILEPAGAVAVAGAKAYLAARPDIRVRQGIAKLPEGRGQGTLFRS